MANQLITELKPSEMELALEDAIRSNVVPIVLGSPGMGKSAIVKKVVRKMKMNLVDERVSTMDLTDWRGVPDIDRTAGRTVWYPPNFLPRPRGKNEKGYLPTVVFFDEITQCPPQCQPPLYQLLLDNRLGTVYTAPEDTRWIAAGNLMDDGTFVNKIGSALRDRMVVLYLKQDTHDWSAWAHEADLDPSVIAFIRFRPALLYAFDKREWASPTARGWEFVSRIVKNARNNGRIIDALIEGKIGHAAMVEFTAFLRVFRTLPPIETIIAHPDTAQLPPADKPELAYAISNALSLHMAVCNVDNIMIYLDRLNEEYGMFAVKCAIRRDPVLKETPAYTKWLLQHADAMTAV